LVAKLQCLRNEFLACAFGGLAELVLASTRLSESSDVALVVSNKTKKRGSVLTLTLALTGKVATGKCLSSV